MDLGRPDFGRYRARQAATPARRAVRWLGQWACGRERASSAALMSLANYDGLTGLPNRGLFSEEAARLIDWHGAGTIMLLDLDHFREINDVLGHKVGDRALAAISRRLQQAVPEEQLLARFAGDEFALLLPGVSNLRAACRAAEQLLDSFQAGFDVGGEVLHVHTSIGVAVAPYHGADAEELIAAADLALNEAKRRGGGMIRFFEPHLRRQVASRHTMREALRRAFNGNEFELLYQPQMAFESRRIVGVEALLRWNHPERGQLLPAQFVSELNDMPISAAVGDWVLETAIAQGARWARGGTPLRVGVNLFASQFHAHDLARHIDSLLLDHGLPPHLLELELTEAVAISDCKVVKRALSALHERGVRIALDDFGTGYASLELLKKFPVTRLKIDKSFVEDLRRGTCEAVLVDAITGLARTFGLEVIAEGIETTVQEQWLIEAGCQEGQGYLYGKPTKAEWLACLMAGTGGTPATQGGLSSWIRRCGPASERRPDQATEKSPPT